MLAHAVNPRVIAGKINSTNLRMYIVHDSVTVCLYLTLIGKDFHVYTHLEMQALTYEMIVSQSLISAWRLLVGRLETVAMRLSSLYFENDPFRGCATT